MWHVPQLDLEPIQSDYSIVEVWTKQRHSAAVGMQITTTSEEASASMEDERWA